MILNSKQLEELESIHDSATDFQEDSGDSDADSNIDDSADSAFAWRRGMLEKAAANVKKALGSAIDPQNVYNSGALLYDRKASKFGRVVESEAFRLKLAYLSGKVVDIKQNQLKEPPRPEVALVPTEKSKEKNKKSPKTKLKTVKNKEPAVKAVATVKEIKLPKVTAKPEAAIVSKAPLPTKKTLPIKTIKKSILKSSKPAPIPAKTKPAQATRLEKTSRIKSTSNKGKCPTAATTKKSPTTKTKKKTTKQKVTAFVSYDTISDPIADPNSYIKQHFHLMSNKELAAVTGLSEHTIRRKLGEWGLKRISKINR
ncbi:MAG: hypothetical protein O2897_04655 [bacterium]|nr:hypothetical protein [bacterium]